MCPITQLSQSSEFRTVQDCVVLSRPVRASHVHRALHRLLQDVSAPQDGPDDFLVSSSMPPAVEEVTGVRVLIAMHDAEQRMVLKAMLTRDINECFVCDTVDMLATMLKRSSSGWSHHILFIEPTDASGSEDKALLALVAKIRQIEEDNSILHKMSIVGVMAA